jgi:DNA-binding transcriptional regulator YiaG
MAPVKSLKQRLSCDKMALSFKTNRLIDDAMSEIRSFRDVIDLWGSREAMAAELRASSRTISKWWQRDRIPAEWWSAILASPVAGAGGVTADKLAELAAREGAEARP